jgi:hypothetical protein
MYVQFLFGDNRSYVFYCVASATHFLFLLEGNIMSKKKKITIIIAFVLIAGLAGYFGFGYFMVQRQYLHGDNTTDVVDDQSSDTTGETVYDDYDDYYNYNLSDETETEPTTSVTDLGFYNISDLTDEYGNCILVEIKGYNSDDGGYVFCNDSQHEGKISGLLLKSGFVQRIQFNVNTYPSYEEGRGPYAYTIVSNDGISFAGDGSVLINEKINLNDSAVVFKSLEHFSDTYETWYVPATMIDWSTKDDNFVSDTGNTAYTRYFINTD